MPGGQVSARFPPELADLLDAAPQAARDKAWTALLATHTRLLLHTARHVTYGYDAAMDAYTFLVEQLSRDDFRRLRAYEPDGRTKFTTWLVVVSRRLCLDYVRHKYGRYRSSAAPSSEQRAVRRQLADLVAAELDPARTGTPGADDPETRLIERPWTISELASESDQPAEAQDINDAGYVAGWLGSYPSVPMVWEPLGTGAALPIPGGSRGGQALALNNTGQAAGVLSPGMAVLWHRDETGTWNAVPLGGLPGSTYSGAVDLTDRGDDGRLFVAGNSDGGSGTGQHAARWTLEEYSPGSWQVVAVEEMDPPAGDARRTAEAVNASGLVVGYAGSNRGGGWWEAVRWFAGTTIGEVLPRRGGKSSYARDVNSAGWIVGQAAGRAVLWREQ